MDWCKSLNRLFKSSRHSEAASKKLVRAYAQGLPIKTTAKLAGLTERRTVTLLGNLRMHLFEFFQRQIAEHQTTDEWRQFLREHLKALTLMIEAKQSADLESQDEWSLSFFSLPDADKLGGFMELASTDRQRFQELLLREFIRELQKLKNIYHLTAVRARRGVRRETLEYFERENGYRFVVFLIKSGTKRVDIENRLRRFSGDRSVLQFDRTLYQQLFRTDKAQWGTIEAEILEELSKNPLP